MEKKCPCKGDYLDKFIQPAILSMLCESSAHGFYLLTELNRRGLVSNVDTAGFYRTLRRLESDGKLAGVWEMEDGGKPRKVYSLTETGVRCLRNWQATLRGYLVLVGSISAAVEQAVEALPEEETGGESHGA